MTVTYATPATTTTSVRRALAFDDNPPLSIPLRFFLSAPLFTMLAAALLLWQGEAALISRWSPLTLALTHLLVLGTLSMVMAGALLQMLPVVAGVAVPRVALTGGAIHAGLVAGTLLLAAAFWWQRPFLFRLALCPLVAALLLFIGACTVALWRQGEGVATAVMASVRQALAALAITLVLGALLAAAFAWPGVHSLPLVRLTDLHALWGLGGWVGLLVIGIAFQVVPMFMVTEPYPEWITRGAASLLFVLLAAASASSAMVPSPTGALVHQVVLALLACGFALFGAMTLYLLARRKRPRADPTTLYWRTAMVCLLAASTWPLWPMWPLLPLLRVDGMNAAPLMLGVLLLVGFALSAINGMLYKIVPFLVWYGLQGTPKLPNVGKMIPEAAARLQYAAHVTSLLLLLAACWWPGKLAQGAGALLLAAALGLWINMLTAVRLCRRTAIKE